jgi:ligand-binding sensor domain-containing protein
MKQLCFVLFCATFAMSGFCQEFTNFTEADGLIDNSVNCVAVDGNDHLWFGTQNGLSSFDGTSWTGYTTSSGIIDNAISAIAVMNNGDIWVGTDFGASKYDGSVWTSYTEADGIGDNRINHIAEGPDGRIWFGDYDGVSVLDGSVWTSYNMNDGLPFGGINYTAFDSNYDVWLGAGLGGLIKFDGNTFEAYSENEGLINKKVRSVLVDNQDNKWVGTAEGVSVFNSANEWVEHHTKMLILPPPDTLNPVEDIVMDSDGNIWAGIYVDYLVTEGGISVYNADYWYDFDVSDGLVGPVVRRLAVDSQDNIWIATSTGVSKLSNTPVSVSMNTSNPIEIYPNPGTGLYSVRSDQQINELRLTIRNISGQLVQSKTIHLQKECTFEIHGDSGIYFVEISQNKEPISIIKLIKK